MFLWKIGLRGPGSLCQRNSATFSKASRPFFSALVRMFLSRVLIYLLLTPWIPFPKPQFSFPNQHRSAVCWVCPSWEPCSLVDLPSPSFLSVCVFTCLPVLLLSLMPPSWLGGKESACQSMQEMQQRRCQFSPWVGKISWRRKWQPTPVF